MPRGRCPPPSFLIPCASQILPRENPLHEGRLRGRLVHGQANVGSAVRLHRFRCGHGASPVLPFGPSLHPLSRTSQLLWPRLTPARRPTNVAVRRAAPHTRGTTDAGQVSPDKMRALSPHNPAIYPAPGQRASSCCADSPQG